MDFTIRPLTQEEHKYTYAQSTQLDAQTGHIGYLRGDFDTGGYSFHTTWFDNCEQYKTMEFRKELQEVISALRSDQYGLLKDRYSMRDYGHAQPDNRMPDGTRAQFGFRVDTMQYAFLLRCNPGKGDYEFYCHCYISQWLDHHIGKAREGIRFIDSHYNELFRLTDGESILLSRSDGSQVTRSCRYIDSTHVEMNRTIYHICEFAELTERTNCVCAPEKMDPKPIQPKRTSHER